MSLKIDKLEKAYLEALINKGPKEFELLYSFTKDGCNSTVFHEKCDNQGATVTIMYNTLGSVYGGYTNVSWVSSVSRWNKDEDAFLFTLKYNGNLSLQQFPLKSDQAGYATYFKSSFGPTFGRGHDIKTFSGSVLPYNGVFKLNGSVNLNTFNSYDTKGLSANQVTNSIQTVTELHVYKVVDAKEETSSEGDVSWRMFDFTWDDKHLASLVEEVSSFSPSSEMSINQSNILVLGHVGAGKSSYINTIASIVCGKMSRLAISGSAEGSITSKYRMYALRSRTKGDTLNFRLCDTRGLEESNGIESLEMNYILSGNVPNWYQFNPTIPISPDSCGFKKNPSPSDCIHTVCLVVDGSTVDVISQKMLERIKSLQKVAYLKGVPMFVLVTKIDKVCAVMETDLRSTFSNVSIRDLVDKVSQMFGVPRNNVLPTKNYEREMVLQDDVSTLALLNLKQILMASEDFMYNLMDERSSLESCKESESVN